MSNYININIETNPIIPLPPVSTGLLAIVGYSESVTDGLIQSGEISIKSSVTDINDTYGRNSSLARSAREAIMNGANPVICVPTDATDITYVTTPDDISAGLTSRELTDTPVLGTIVVIEGTIDTPTKTLVEGIDYTVDVGHKTIYFTELSVAGKVSYRVMQSSDLVTPLTKLESQECNFVVLSYTFSNNDLITASTNSLLDHIKRMSEGNRRRIGIVAMPSDDSTVTVASELQGREFVLFAHKSKKDIASIVGGLYSTLLPQENTMLKIVQGDESTGDFEDSEKESFFANQINTLSNITHLPGGFRTSYNFTLSNNNYEKFIDTVRVIFYSSTIIRNRLFSPTVLSTLKLSTINGMDSLRTIMNSTLNGLVSDGTIDRFDYEIQHESIVRKAVDRRTTEEITALNRSLADRTFGIYISIVYNGAVQSLDPVDITYSN